MTYIMSTRITPGNDLLSGKPGVALRPHQYDPYARHHDLLRSIENGKINRLSNKNKMKLRRNTVLITGGSAGIGLAFAEHFLKEGNKVIVCGRNK